MPVVTVELLRCQSLPLLSVFFVFFSVGLISSHHYNNGPHQAQFLITPLHLLHIEGLQSNG